MLRWQERATVMSLGSKSSCCRTLMKLSPLLVPFVLLFLGGLTLAVSQSLGFWLPLPYDGGMFDAYTALLDPHLLESVGLSLYVALVSALVSVSVGAMLAYAVWRLPDTLERASVVYKVPLILPHIAVAFIVLVFWTKSGLFSSVAYHLGLLNTPAEFPSVLYGNYGLGMILAYTYKEVPFMVILGYAVLKRVSPRVVVAAKMLGAGEVYTFFHVVLPHMYRVMHVVFIILFLYAFGAFDIPFLLGESSPGMLSVEVFNLYFRRDLANRPVAMAVLVCMFLFSLAFIVLYTKLASSLEQKERKL